ncbi:asparagine synthase (glutamine-hydrolyzing) [Actinomadura barringtoniae]|uniref:asparagine synthase (glutamine-hydrolyzing) n=1 Tax=Actinomadura barringtoniae TaxID=1427535 RepID=A0A939T2S1_9ACTN|nr:asparagine synthase (glutamine-hydrolyzing) [Actinomadura barringtoniae]MBO2445659.1 asparagine synthase (glutamine-hydrolyzing) [Actinomadura barringtoniae]
MCGITGWVDWTRDLQTQRPVISDMTRTQIPRGPDDEGAWLSRHAAFGHRRLAVIDIEGGLQPMVRTGRNGEPVVITFSGEIYNFHELRAELRSAGWSFTTRSDTEVLLTAYLHWGTDLVTHLNGMYAFAIWDEQRQQLLLVRDRLGIKPLYYAELGEGIIFGSEPKALLAHPEMKAEVDLEGIAELMAVPRARTPGHAVYRGMRELKPGHLVVADASGCRESRYWRVEAKPHTKDFDASTADVRDLLTDIVHRQIVADVPVGTLLSGGIDSSAITALAAREFTGELTSFSVSVPAPSEPGSDLWRPSPDEPYAKLVAERLGLKHIVTKVSTGSLVDGIEIGLQARDLPGWGDLDTSMYHLFQTVRSNCTVALSGESADEMFGGYTWQIDEGFIGHTSFPWMYSRRQPQVLLREEIRRQVRPEEYEAERYREALSEVPHLDGEDPGRRREREVFYLGLTRWLGALLDRKDRMSMAVGLEVRVPFADHRLAEYLFNIPAGLKAHGGVEKALLRQACADLLPDEIVNRPKSAYPASQDPEYRETVRTMVVEMIDDPDAPLFDLMDRERVRTAVTSELDTLPGPITARTSAIGLSYLLELNRWLSRVRVVT